MDAETRVFLSNYCVISTEMLNDPASRSSILNDGTANVADYESSCTHAVFD